MKRTASCACGQLNVTVLNNPVFVSACSCRQCQRRTGSAFGISAYFGDDQVIDIDGESKSYIRTGHSRNSFEMKFCPTCGSTVFWFTGALKNHIGIAAGCFGQADFPEPTVSFWNESKHDWVSFPYHWHQESKQG